MPYLDGISSVKEESIMTMTDPVADMLTRIRNANQAGHQTVEIPASKMKKSIASILKEEGYIEDYEFIEDDKQGALKIRLKYAPGKTRAYTRCRICGRPHSVLKKYGVCRICFRELAYKGEIPGVKKASW